MKTAMLEKVKIDFSEPHITYRLKNGQAVVGTTTAIGKLDKPALPLWGFVVGREPMYQTIPQAAEQQKINIKTLKKDDAVSWAFAAGQQRKNASLYGGRDKAADIGTVAHKILEARERGLEVDNSNIQEEIWKAALECIKSHDKWFEGLEVKTILFEEEFVSEKYLYGGTLDKLAYVNKDSTLIDYKSGKDIYESHFIQLSAYTNLAIENGYEVERAIIVNMPKTKGDNFAIKSVSASSLFEAGYFKWFLASVDAYYAEQQTKKFKNSF